MNKKQILAAASFAVAIVSVAHAEQTTYGGLPIAEQQDEAYLSQQRRYGSSEGGFYVAGFGGYAFERETPYFGAQVGYAFAERSWIYGSKVFFQFADVSFDETDDGVKEDTSYTSFSLGVISDFEIGNSTTFYLGASIGQTDQEKTYSGGGERETFQDDTLYVDLTAGFRYNFTNNLSANFGVRYMQWRDFEVDFGQLGTRGDTGLELGLSYKF